MGMYDALNSYEGQQALGLLAAAGGRSDGAGFGQRMLEGLGQGEKWKQQQQAQALQKIQMDNYLSEIEARKLASVKDARMQGMVEQMFGGTQSASAGSESNPLAGGANPTATPRPASGAMGITGLAKQLGLPQEAIQADMVFNGGKKISEMLASRSEPKWQNINGNLVNTNAQGFTGGMQGGMNASANGQVTAWQPDGRGGLVVGAPAGALDTARAYGQVAADQKPIKVFDPAQQREVFATEGNIVRGQQPGQQSQPGITGSGYNGGSRDGANAESIRMMQSELQNPKLTFEDRAGINREIQRMQAQSGTTGGAMAAGPSASELARNEAAKTSAVDTAKADVVRDTGKQTNAKMYGQMNAGIDRAIELLKSGPTASGFGNAVDGALGIVGMSTKGGDTASQLNTLSGWLTSNVPRMEGPQSDKDVVNYRIQAGMVGDATKPISQRLAAATEVKALQDKYAELNGYAPPKTTEQPQAKTATLSDITATAKASGRSTKEVTDALRAKGYTIGGM